MASLAPSQMWGTLPNRMTALLKDKMSGFDTALSKQYSLPKRKWTRGFPKRKVVFPNHDGEGAGSPKPNDGLPILYQMRDIVVK